MLMHFYSQIKWFSHLKIWLTKFKESFYQTFNKNSYKCLNKYINYILQILNKILKDNIFIIKKINIDYT